MKRLPLSSPRSPHYARAVSNDAGFLVMKVDGRHLLWITIDGHAHEFECETLAHVLDLLAQPDLVEKFRERWARSEEALQYENCSLEAFSVLWATVLGDVEDICSRWDDVQSVPDRVKKQLLWAFDTDGTLNAARFMTILQHEHVTLSREELLELVSDLVRKPFLPAFTPTPN